MRMRMGTRLTISKDCILKDNEAIVEAGGESDPLLERDGKCLVIHILIDWPLNLTNDNTGRARNNSYSVPILLRGPAPNSFSTPFSTTYLSRISSGLS
jgi:hypothetical protein